MHSDGKKRRSFVALLFAAGDLRRSHEPCKTGVPTVISSSCYSRTGTRMIQHQLSIYPVVSGANDACDHLGQTESLLYIFLSKIHNKVVPWQQERFFYSKRILSIHYPWEIDQVDYKSTQVRHNHFSVKQAIICRAKNGYSIVSDFALVFQLTQYVICLTGRDNLPRRAMQKQNVCIIRV